MQQVGTSPRSTGSPSSGLAWSAGGACVQNPPRRTTSPRSDTRGVRDPGVASVRPILDDDQGAARTQHLADGWVPSLGYLKPQDIDAANARIDEAAAAAGREPSAIRRVVNVGPLSADELTSLALEHGFDTFIVGEEEMQRVAADLAPRARELIAAGRGTR